MDQIGVMKDFGGKEIMHVAINIDDILRRVNCLLRWNIQFFMFNFIIWNIRGIGCPTSKMRLKNLCRIYNVSFLVILEPLISNTKLDGTARWLGFKHAIANVANKIWVFWKDPLRIDVIGDFTQVMHCSIDSSNIHFAASFVYASSSRYHRKMLWEQISHFHSICSIPWLVGGDFNTISNPSERIGGSPPISQAMEDFNSMIMDCKLTDIGFSGNKFTWNRGLLWQRLDRVLFNEFWINSVVSTNIEHLSRTLSDHSPLLIRIKEKSINFSSHFRFQNMWLLHDSFMDLVQNNWLAPLHPDNSIFGMRRFWFKLKRMKQVLNWWNQNVFKNLFSNIVQDEEDVNNFENLCLSFPSVDNFNLLNNAKDCLSKLQVQEETFWKQKVATKHLIDGDNNTKYFHALVNRKRALNCIHKIKRDDGTITEDGVEIANLAVQLILIKSVLCSLPVYSFQALLPTTEFSTKISRICNKFFWKGTGKNSKIIWSSWDKVCGTLDEGALGCKSMTDMAYAFSCKLWYNFRANVSLWAKFMHIKYCGGNHPTTVSYRQGDSRVWHRLCKVKWVVEPMLNWGLGCGDISFWQDRWLGGTSIDSIFNTSSKENVKVNYFFDNNCWDFGKLCNVLPISIAQQIFNIPFNINSKDLLLCGLTVDGRFSVKDAWHTFRSKKDVSNLFSMIWHKTIPTTVAVFVWRVLHKLIPTDEILIKRGFVLSSKCQCCYHVENMHHVFLSSPLAVKTWTYFEDIFKVNYFNAKLSIKDMLKCWFSKSKGHIKNVIPSLILWYLWLDRNNSRFSNVVMNHNRIIQNVKNKVVALFYAKLLTAKDFNNHYSVASALGITLEEVFPPNVSRIIYWTKPPINYYKINVAGFDSDSHLGFGGIIRDYQGNLVLGFAGPLQNADINFAIISAVLNGLKSCITLDLNCIIFEVDSTFSLHMLNSLDDITCNSSLFYILREVKNSLRFINFSFSFVHKEGNACANWLARWGWGSDHLSNFSGSNLPHALNGLLRLDKVGVPYVKG
ncbi:hypothetical protein M5K25_018326 [Dendrobium thyrsiflorum]|uniref:RNase H type-1 domain-containing protein n=1 Tax=Dendrobium thyrsiflorum TaxID=117978 RepID=A0ABD0UHZ5_DENTH